LRAEASRFNVEDCGGTDIRCQSCHDFPPNSLRQ
jgi:hypothetical protein